MFLLTGYSKDILQQIKEDFQHQDVQTEDISCSAVGEITVTLLLRHGMFLPRSRHPVLHPRRRNT